MRPWRPLPDKRLVQILSDTERDYPQGLHSDDDVYRLCRELLQRRQKDVAVPRAKPTGALR